MSGPNFIGIMENSKSKFVRALEVATNLSIILVALVGATVLIKNYLLRPSASPDEVKQAVDKNAQGLLDDSRIARRARPTGPAEGTQLSVPDFDWAASNQTIVLALSNKCHFCTESAPFYKRLVSETAQRKDVRLLAVFPQSSDEGKKYLDELGVSIEQIRQAPLDSLAVKGTPTLVIVDNRGVVKQSWVGQLTTEREAEVLNRVKA